MVSGYNIYDSLVLSKCKDAININSSRLDLSYCKIEEVPNIIEQCKTVVHLILNNNKLTKVPTFFSNLDRLQMLRLDSNKFVEFPLAICTIPQLRTLSINCNEIVKLPPQIGRLKMLREFWCENNALQELPEEISHCEHLQFLYAEGNQLQRLPDSIGLLSNLQKLDLHNNQLTTMPVALYEMKKLRFVSLECNLITEVPPGMEFKCIFFLENNPVSENYSDNKMFHKHRHVVYTSNFQESSDSDEAMVEPGIGAIGGRVAGGASASNSDSAIDVETSELATKKENKHKSVIKKHRHLLNKSNFQDSSESDEAMEELDLDLYWDLPEGDDDIEELGAGAIGARVKGKVSTSNSDSSIVVETSELATKKENKHKFEIEEHRHDLDNSNFQDPFDSDEDMEELEDLDLYWDLPDSDEDMGGAGDGAFVGGVEANGGTKGSSSSTIDAETSGVATKKENKHESEIMIHSGPYEIICAIL